MYRPDPLRPWKQMFDNASRRDLTNSHQKMVMDRVAINSLLSESTSKLKVVSQRNETIERLSAPINHIPTVDAVLNFAFSGEPTSFDVLPISSPSQFSNLYNFDIAFLNELIPFCLISLEHIFKENLFFEKPLRAHNLRMASEIQTFISTRKDLLDIAKCRIQLNEPDCEVSSEVALRIRESMCKTLNRIKNITFEESAFLRFTHLNKFEKSFSYNSTPNDYLFSQRLALDEGLDINLKHIPPQRMNHYLINQCPIKSNFEKFDFLRHLFINKSVIDLPFEYRAIQIFHDLDSLRHGYHGIIDALTTEEKSVPNPLHLFDV